MLRQKISDSSEETWDKKKIAIGIAIFLLVVVGVFAARKFILPKLFPKIFPPKNVTTVEGTQTQNTSGLDTGSSQENTQTSHASHFSLPSVQDAQKALNTIQQQVEHINISEIASSSPQVLQILKEIQSLPQVPGNTAKDACLQICGKL